MGTFNFRPIETQDAIDAAQDVRLTATETVANAAAPQATTYTKTELTMPIGNLSNPLLDLPLRNDLSMKQGVGSVVFDRATTATYVDRYGVLKYAAIDEPRFEKDGLLLEGGSTNLMWTQDMVTSVGVPTVNLNSVVSPDGSTNATEIINTAGTNATSLAGISLSDSGVIGDVYTASIYCKAGTGIGGDKITFNPYFAGNSEYNANFTFSTESHSGHTFTHEFIGDGWYRLSVVMTATVDFEYIAYRAWECGRSMTRDVGDSNYVFGFQLEKLPFASSYIPTTDSAVTRSADVCSVDNIGNMPNTNTVDTNFAVAVDFKVLGISNTSQAFISQYYSSTNYWYMRQYPFDSRIGYYNESGNVSTAVVTYDQNKDITKIRRYILSINALEQSIIDDGVVIRTDTRATELMTDNLISEKLYLGSIRGATNPMWGHLRNLKIYDKALTPTEAGLA